MEENYEDLVQKCQNGEIDELQFIMAQKDLARDFLTEMKNYGKIPSIETAKEWLDKYENDNLYM